MSQTGWRRYEKNLIEQLKTYLIMEWIIFIGVIILLGAILQVNLNSKQIKEDGDKNETALKSITGFIESKRIVGVNNKYLFAVDENNKKIAIIRSVRKVVIPFDQIISVEVFEDNTMLQQKSSLRTIGGAVIGGAIAGGAGAIVGGLSGGAQQNKKVSKVQVKIKLRDINTPSYTIDCFNCKTMTVGGKPIKPSSSEGHLYKKGLNHAHRIADTISAIIDITDKADKSPEQIKFQVQKTTVSIADELTKLADLKEKGILTEEEFILQKKALLGKAETSDVNTLEHIQGATLIDELPQDVKDALDSGKKIEAVKLYMDFKGCSLSEAVEDIESLN